MRQPCLHRRVLVRRVVVSDQWICLSLGVLRAIRRRNAVRFSAGQFTILSEPTDRVWFRETARTRAALPVMAHYRQAKPSTDRWRRSVAMHLEMLTGPGNQTLTIINANQLGSKVIYVFAQGTGFTTVAGIGFTINVAESQGTGEAPVTNRVAQLLLMEGMPGSLSAGATTTLSLRGNLFISIRPAKLMSRRPPTSPAPVASHAADAAPNRVRRCRGCWPTPVRPQSPWELSGCGAARSVPRVN
jgi:hypothetical protein